MTPKAWIGHNILGLLSIAVAAVSLVISVHADQPFAIERPGPIVDLVCSAEKVTNGTLLLRVKASTSGIDVGEYKSPSVGAVRGVRMFDTRASRAPSRVGLSGGSGKKRLTPTS